MARFGLSEKLLMARFVTYWRDILKTCHQPVTLFTQVSYLAALKLFGKKILSILRVIGVEVSYADVLVGCKKYLAQGVSLPERLNLADVCGEKYQLIICRRKSLMGLLRAENPPRNTTLSRVFFSDAPIRAILNIKTMVDVASKSLRDGKTSRFFLPTLKILLVSAQAMFIQLTALITKKDMNQGIFDGRHPKNRLLIVEKLGCCFSFQLKNFCMNSSDAVVSNR